MMDKYNLREPRCQLALVPLLRKPFAYGIYQ